MRRIDSCTGSDSSDRYSSFRVLTARDRAAPSDGGVEAIFEKQGLVQSLIAGLGLCVALVHGSAQIDIANASGRSYSLDPRAIGPWCQRNDAIERIAEVGRCQWRKESGAHQQARAENGMYRCKRIIGDGLRASKFEAQAREVLIAVNVINRMMELGMPESVKVAA